MGNLIKDKDIYRIISYYAVMDWERFSPSLEGAKKIVEERSCRYTSYGDGPIKWEIIHDESGKVIYRTPKCFSSVIYEIQKIKGRRTGVERRLSQNVRVKTNGE